MNIIFTSCSSEQILDTSNTSTDRMNVYGGFDLYKNGKHLTYTMTLL